MLAGRVKLTFQISGSVSLGLWAVVLVIPGASSGSNSLLSEMTWWIAGYASSSDAKALEFLILSAVLLGYGIFAFRAASRRD